jgi:hypothetical protein
MTEGAPAAAVISNQIDATKAQFVMFTFHELSFDEARWRGLAKLDREQFLEQAYLIRKGLCALRAALEGATPWRNWSKR